MQRLAVTAREVTKVTTHRAVCKWLDGASDLIEGSSQDQAIRNIFALQEPRLCG
jgi:hypothetical protein